MRSIQDVLVHVGRLQNRILRGRPVSGRSSRWRILSGGVALAAALVVCPWMSASAYIIAGDNADNDAYADGFQPLPGYDGDNGGTGFVGWVQLEIGVPGSMYVADQIYYEGVSEIRSWGLEGTYALGRGFSNAVLTGQWRLLSVHDPDNTGFSGFNLRSSTNIGSGFGESELIRFGMDVNQEPYGLDNGTGIQLSTDGGDSFQFIDCGWVNGWGDTLEYIISWTGGGHYTLSVSNLDEEVATVFSGSMGTGSVAMVGVAIYGATLDEHVTFDDFQIVPEPSGLGLLALGLLVVRGRGRRTVRRAA